MTQNQNPIDGFFVHLRNALAGGKMVRDSLPQVMRAFSDPKAREEVLRMTVQFAAVVGREKLRDLLADAVHRLDGEGRRDAPGP
jgi:hypothetical protein